jgi:transposase
MNAAASAATRGEKASPSMIWRLFDRHDITFKKRPYSPDFNPIENAYSKLKSALRKLAERTVAGLIAFLEACAVLFKPEECKNYFEAGGYDPAEILTLDTT